MDKIKDALTRKIGPLPAWAWLGIFGIGYYYYKNHIANNSTSATQASSTVTTPTPQSPITVSPGDSVYNPNTGTLTTEPGGGGGYGGGGGGGGQLANALSNIATALTNLNNNAPICFRIALAHKFAPAPVSGLYSDRSGSIDGVVLDDRVSRVRDITCY